MKNEMLPNELLWDTDADRSGPGEVLDLHDRHASDVALAAVADGSSRWCPPP